MNLLMLTPYVPYPPSSGGQIRTLNLLKYLAKNHKIILVSLYKNDEEKEYLIHLKKYCQSIYLCKRAKSPWTLSNILKALFSFLPFLIIRNFSLEAKDTIQKLLKENKFDVIHAETFYIMPHIPKTSIPIFLVEQTVEYKVYQHFVRSLFLPLQLFFYLDILKLNFWERYYWKKAYLVGTVSETDKKLINRLEPQIKPVVVPNGAGDEIIAKYLTPKTLKSPIILFLGNFYWLQNTEAANFLLKKIFPLLQKDFPDINLIIAGQGAKNRIKHQNSNNIQIIDIQSVDVNRVKLLYQTSTLFLAPIFGPGGTRLKILAAMANGMPVISTKIGITGLLVRNYKHVLIAENEKEFVQKSKEVLTNKILFDSLRNNAFTLVKEIYNWKKISQKLEVIYGNIKKHEDRN